jgi:hypothetical protein
MKAKEKNDCLPYLFFSLKSIYLNIFVLGGRLITNDPKFW